MLRTYLFLFALLACSLSGWAQDNYEIQVYAADTVEPRTTMVEFHTNFTASGSKTIMDGVLPTNHAIHETIEITQGFNDWFETGFYIFTSARSGSTKVALASGRKHFQRDWLPATAFFT